MEIILPRAGNQLEKWGQLLQLFYSDPSYQQSDQAFIDEWDAAVSVYGDVFRNVTQFNTSFSQKPAAEGCAASCDAESSVC